MLKLIRKLGSFAFVVGFFVAVFVVIPWHVSVLNAPELGGPLPIWVKWAVYLLMGGIVLVLVSVAMEQACRKPAETVKLAEHPQILTQNTDRVPGREVVESLGLVKGHTIYAIWLGKDISAFVRLLLGGELTEYTEMMGKARQVALERMRKEAAEVGADAVINVRFMTTSVIASAAELLAYGTAVKLAPHSDE